MAAADHVICISESTRRDLLTTYDLPEERVSVTHLGFDPLESLLTGEPSTDFKVRVLGADAPYLLYVGSRANYKNFQGLLDAYAASAWMRTNFFLLCFGGGDFTGAERAAISKAGVDARIRYLERVQVLVFIACMPMHRYSSAHPSTRDSAYRYSRPCRSIVPWPAATRALCPRWSATRLCYLTRWIATRSAAPWNRFWARRPPQPHSRSGVESADSSFHGGAAPKRR